jgi:hypothetical protein
MQPAAFAFTPLARFERFGIRKKEKSLKNARSLASFRNNDKNVNNRVKIKALMAEE